MASASEDPPPRNPKAKTFPHSIHLPVYQEEWVLNLLGDDDRELSGLIQAMFDEAIAGRLDAAALAKNLKGRDAQERATAYLRAQEASMSFEEDVAAIVARVFKTLRGTKRGLRLARRRIHKSDTNTFIADLSLEDRRGGVVASIVCRSSPREDRLQLGLAIATIGARLTGAPVLTVCPYFIEDSAATVAQFKTRELPITDLAGLSNFITGTIEAAK